MEISSRRVHFAGMTQHPNEEWMTEVANKVTNAETGFLRGKKILLLDQDVTGHDTSSLSSVHSP